MFLSYFFAQAAESRLTFSALLRVDDCGRRHRLLFRRRPPADATFSFAFLSLLFGELKAAKVTLESSLLVVLR